VIPGQPVRARLVAHIDIITYCYVKDVNFRNHEMMKTILVSFFAYASLQAASITNCA